MRALLLQQKTPRTAICLLLETGHSDEKSYTTGITKRLSNQARQLPELEAKQF